MIKMVNEVGVSKGDLSKMAYSTILSDTNSAMADLNRRVDNIIKTISDIKKRGILNKEDDAKVHDQLKLFKDHLKKVADSIPYLID